MSGFTKCPNCFTEGFTIPLKEEKDSMVCNLCGFSKKVT